MLSTVAVSYSYQVFLSTHLFYLYFQLFICLPVYSTEHHSICLFIYLFVGLVSFYLSLCRTNFPFVCIYEALNLSTFLFINCFYVFIHLLIYKIRNLVIFCHLHVPQSKKEKEREKVKEYKKGKRERKITSKTLTNAFP